MKSFLLNTPHTSTEHKTKKNNRYKYELQHQTKEKKGVIQNKKSQEI